MTKNALVLALTAMLAAGCTEGAVAPKATAVDSTIPGGGATAALTGTDTLRFTFVIDPSRNITYYLGAGNTIVFPANSLCEPTRSSYGFGEWDKACPLATAPVTIQTKAWLDREGLAHIDFDRHVRFVPTSNPAGWVMLSLYDYGASTTAWTKIAYCHTAQQGSCMDEAKFDPTLATVKNPVTGQYVRRLKHFSGYSLTSGRSNEME